MKARGRVASAGGDRSGNAATDLLACFPTRAHLALMPKPICSPARSTEAAKRHHIKTANRGQASPLFRAKPMQPCPEITEPTSPKVTCSGQIKTRPKSGSFRNWQSVMEEIEKLHDSRKVRKRPNWFEALGLKKEAMQFLACLKGLRLDMRCFGSFHGSAAHDSDSYGDDEEQGEEENEVEEGNNVGFGDHGASRTIFSKWLMILQENQGKEIIKGGEGREVGDGSRVDCSVPPKNALLLMRCRSAPTTGRAEERGEKIFEDNRSTRIKEVEEEEVEEKQKQKKEKLVATQCELGNLKVSTDVAMETWLVGRSDPFSRSRSWKR